MTNRHVTQARRVLAGLGNPGAVQLRLLALGVLALLVWWLDPASAASTPEAHDHASGDHAHLDHGYDGPYFGENNFPPGCTRSAATGNAGNICFHMADISSLNQLDSPQIDVLILVPVSPAAERDMRIMRQSVEMWEAGIDYHAGRMGLEWLQDVDFHVTIDAVDLTGEGGGGEFTTYPVIDPEIVVVVANPSAGVGVGIDPTSDGQDGDDVVCHGLANPFDFEHWENLPGFDRHHDSRSGTYVEDCGGGGGNTCFSVTTGIDPEPVTVEWWSLFNIVSHEIGHCLTLGHVGDAAVVPGTQPRFPAASHDIMSYSDDIRASVGAVPPVLSKCVSTLDVELFATRMSRYLDVDGDGVVGPGDVLTPNDLVNGLQVQHPADHLYASSTGSPLDCPQPDLGLIPGPRTDWTPEPVPSIEPVLDVTAPAHGATIDDGHVEVTGTVSERSLLEPHESLPTSVTVADDPADATVGQFTEIESFTVTATETHVEAVIQLAQIWPSTEVASPLNYSLLIDGKRYESFSRLVVEPAVEGDNPRTYHELGWMPGGTSEWDLDNHRVLFHIPRAHLHDYGVVAPYQVSVATYHGQLYAAVPDDVAPQPGTSVVVAAPPRQLPEAVEDPSDDDDQDGVPDAADRCPLQPGLTADGCTAQTPSRVEVHVDGVLAGTQDVYADYGPDDFAIPIDLAEGSHTIRVEWLDAGTLLASHELEVRRP